MRSKYPKGNPRRRKKMLEAQENEPPVDFGDIILQSLGNQRIAEIFGGMAQAKLKVSQPGDPQEKEADQVAEAVVSDKPDKTSRTDTIINNIMARSQRGPSGRSVSETPFKNLEGHGQPLSDQNRAFYENRFGQDFSNVRIHSGHRASGLTGSINARAVTYRNHIAFNQGEYRPDTPEGKKLLAHELTHVVQQGKSGVKGVDREEQPYTPDFASDYFLISNLGIHEKFGFFISLRSGIDLTAVLGGIYGSYDLQLLNTVDQHNPNLDLSNGSDSLGIGHFVMLPTSSNAVGEEKAKNLRRVFALWLTSRVGREYFLSIVEWSRNHPDTILSKLIQETLKDKIDDYQGQIARRGEIQERADQYLYSTIDQIEFHRDLAIISDHVYRDMEDAEAEYNTLNGPITVIGRGVIPRVSLPYYITDVTESVAEIVPGVNPQRFENEAGLQAGLYYDRSRNKYILAFTGTQDIVGKDCWTDIKQEIGLWDQQYNDAITLAKDLNRSLGDRLMITGHSLGGGLAQTSGYFSNTPVVAFNPATPVYNSIVYQYSEHREDLEQTIDYDDFLEWASSNVTSYIAQDDILTTLMYHIDTDPVGTIIRLPEVKRRILIEDGQRIKLDQYRLYLGLKFENYLAEKIANGDEFLQRLFDPTHLGPENLRLGIETGGLIDEIKFFVDVDWSWDKEYWENIIEWINFKVNWENILDFSHLHFNSLRVGMYWGPNATQNDGYFMDFEFPYVLERVRRHMMYSVIRGFNILLENDYEQDVKEPGN